MTTRKTLKKYTIEAIISVKNEIDKDPVSKKEIAQIAQEVGIGKNLLKQAFKNVVGVTIKDYRLQKRMERAKEMLEEGRLTRKQIAYKLGYRAPQNFSISFKKKVGLAPIEFQEQYNEAI